MASPIPVIDTSVQYTEGDTDSTITGSAFLFESNPGTNLLSVVSSTTPLPVTIISGGAGNGSILDGVDTAIKATVLDYTNSNPLAVRLTDTNGDYVSAGAGTQYTEDAASVSDPVGSQLIARRRDSLSTETSANGDVTALNATGKGELYVKHVDTVIVDGSATTQPISASSLPLPTGAATASNQSTSNTHLSTLAGAVTSNKFQVDIITIPTTTVTATNLDIRDISNASDSISIYGDVGILDQFDLTNSNPVAVAIVDSNGDQISSFGGGTQYTEDAAAASNPVGNAVILIRKDTPGAEVTTDGDNVAQRGTNYGAAYVTLLDTSGNPVSVGGGTQYTEGDIDTTITGTAMLMEAGSNTLVPVQGNTTDGILVNLGANNDVTVTGTVTVNAGTNLNTSALALETTLSAVKTAVETIDNFISGSKGLVTEDNSAAIKTSVELIDDAIATIASAITLKGMAVAGTDGTNARILKTDASGELQIDVLTMPTVTVTGTVAATQSGTWNIGTLTSITNAVAVTDNAGSLTVDAPVGTPVFVRLSDGSSAITTLPVSLASVPSHAVTNAGTFAVQVDGSALTSLQLIDDAIATTGSAITTKGMAISGTDGTNARILKTDSNGELQIDILSGVITSITNTVTTKETRSSTPGQTSVSDTATSTTILASNSNRLGATIANDSSAVLYLLLGSGTASSTNYTVRMAQYGYYEVPFGYTGQINGVWASDPNDGAARITELT